MEKSNDFIQMKMSPEYVDHFTETPDTSNDFRKYAHSLNMRIQKAKKIINLINRDAQAYIENNNNVPSQKQLDAFSEHYQILTVSLFNENPSYTNKDVEFREDNLPKIKSFTPADRIRTCPTNDYIEEFVVFDRETDKPLNPFTKHELNLFICSLEV